MNTPLRRRFWVETSAAMMTGLLLVITLIWRNWIELILRIDPDQGNGLLEWAIVGMLLVATLVLFASSAYEWRRSRVAIA